MATTTARVATASTTNGTSYASGAFTPTQGDLLVVSVTATDSAAASPTATASANGITFTRISALDATYGASAVNRRWIFIADQLVGASPASMTVTFDCSADAATGATVAVFSVAGGGGRVGTDAIRTGQTATAPNVGSGAADTLTFPAACLTGNVVVIAHGQPSVTAVTAPTSFIATVASSYSTPTAAGGYSRRDSGHTATTVTWGSNVIGAHASVAFELDMTSAAAAINPCPIRSNARRQAVDRASGW